MYSNFIRVLTLHLLAVTFSMYIPQIYVHVHVDAHYTIDLYYM